MSPEELGMLASDIDIAYRNADLDCDEGESASQRVIAIVGS